MGSIFSLTCENVHFNGCFAGCCKDMAECCRVCCYKKTDGKPADDDDDAEVTDPPQLKALERNGSSAGLTHSAPKEPTETDRLTPPSSNSAAGSNSTPNLTMIKQNTGIAGNNISVGRIVYTQPRKSF